MYSVNRRLHRFAVAIEWLEGVARYTRVVAIDNFHDFAHRHVFARDGSQVSDSAPMPDSLDTALALKWAVAYLQRSYAKYIDDYKRS